MIAGKRISLCSLIAVFSTLLATPVSAETVSPTAYKIGELFGLPITNAMVTGWVISLLIILLIRVLIKKPQLVPHRGQAVVENLVSSIRDIMEPIVGKKMIGPTSPLLLAIFTFVLMHNWSGLLPGVGTFGTFDHGHFEYWFRPANSDFNTTFALGVIAAVAAWAFFVLRYAGPGLLIKDLFGNKASREDVGTPLWILLFPLFFMVGLIEVLSIAVRPFSLAFRLYGNVFGGENLLTNMSALVAWIVPTPFYFLEMLIGLVQALVFTLLTAVYIGLICNHGDDEHAH
ncbi:MAG: F-type H+-transporting ATPase subunit a [Puniceicoccaceae bacterium 5H]|nr:MAG: F-type H+-transporting ATPase subunit a [Puniceicoccaceae bacterium 5H]